MRLPMLLAVDAGAIVAVIFGLVSFIGWVMNQINGAKKPPQTPRKRAPRDRTIQDEIDQFLSEREGKPRPDRRRDDEILTADQVEIIDEPPRRPPPPRPSQQKPRPKPKPTPTPTKKSSQTPLSQQPRPRLQPVEQSSTRVTHPAQAASQLGREMQARVTQEMAPRLAATVGKDLPHSVDLSVIKHLGKFSGAGTQAANVGSKAGSHARAAADRQIAAIVEMLRNPDSVRAAIIANEILSQPLARRKK